MIGVKMLKCLAVILVTVCMAACQSRPAGDQESLQIDCLKGPSALSMLHLMDSLAKFNGKEIAWNIYSEPNQIRARLLRQETDIALIPTNLAAILYNLNLPYRLVMVPVWGTLYLCGTDHAISKLEDLKDQRVFSMGRGMNPDIIFRCLLEKSGIDPASDLSLDYSFPSHIDLANAVLAQKARLAVLSEPQLSLVKQQNPDIRIYLDLNALWEEEFGSSLPQTAVMVHQRVLDDSKDRIKALIQNMQWSVSMAIAKPEKTARLAVENQILPTEALVLEALPRCHLKPVSGDELRPAMNAYLTVFYTFNPETIGGQIPDAAFIYP